MDERTLRARMLLGESAMDRLRNSHVAVFASAASGRGARKRLLAPASGG